MLDIYFQPEYGKLYDAIEGGFCETFEYYGISGTVRHMYIKRPVPWLLDGVQYYDAITPYGYGGPIVSSGEPTKELVDGFFGAWSVFCSENKIVCEFVRFHPLVGNGLGFFNKYGAVFNRNTLAVTLSDENYLHTQVTSKCRNMIKKAEKLGVTCVVDTECTAIGEFCDLYHKTMKKDKADDYYFFPKEYFDEMRNKLGNRLVLITAVLDSRIIAASLFMLSDEYMHYHLSATDPECYSYAANNLILKTAIDFGREKKLKLLHLGGGLSSSPEDPLFKFKRSFASKDTNLKDFFIGKAVYDKTIYDKLVEHRNAQSGKQRPDFFPAYRG